LAALQAEGDVDGILDFLVQRVVKEQIPQQKMAADVMKRAEQVIVVRPDATMAEVGDMLEKRQFRACPVISKDGRLMGVVSVTEVWLPRLD
jgi:CBS domain-containing protein